jgi:hypothetical protein
MLWMGCLQQVAVSTVGSIIDDGFEAITEDSDLELARQALPANLKLLEVMLKNDPDNKRLLLLLAEGYNSYALGFVEDTDPDRARSLYQRATEYALRLLRQDEPMSRALDGSIDDLTLELSQRTRDDAPAIFWAAFGMGSYINLTLERADALAMLPKAETMMKFVAQVDSTFYHGGADMFLGTLYGSRPPMLGGNPDVARQHFERALRINGGTFLMTHVYFARSYAVQTQNEGLFDDLLATVKNTSLDVLPSFRLGNAIAQAKAKLLDSRKNDLF